MARPPLEGVVVVTGASSGIGREMARLFAKEARAIVLVARRRARLEELAEELRHARPGLVVHIEERDLADLGSIEPMIASVREKVGEVDVLVNNAGLGDMGVFDHADPKKTEQMITLNVTSLTMLTRALVGGMVERGRGGILNVSSGFGLTFLPGFAAYIGTKHYVTGFTEALRVDLTGTGVAVSQLCPGPVATEFEENAGNFTGQKVPGWIELSAERCAKIAHRGFARGAALIVPGLVMKLTMLSARFSPRFMQRWIGALLARPLRRKQLGR